MISRLNWNEEKKVEQPANNLYLLPKSRFNKELSIVSDAQKSDGLQSEDRQALDGCIKEQEKFITKKLPEVNDADYYFCKSVGSKKGNLKDESSLKDIKSMGYSAEKASK